MHWRTGDRKALLKLNGTSFSGCEIFDTRQNCVIGLYFSKRPSYTSKWLSYFADYHTASRCIIRESATSQSGIISKLSDQRYRSLRALITEQHNENVNERSDRLQHWESIMYLRSVFAYVARRTLFHI
jgi:hypothetical protein